MAVELSSPSALLHLSYRLLLCTYFYNVYIMINIINRHPCYKQGLCCFLQISFDYMGASADKAEFYLLNWLSCHNTAWELHNQGAKESLDALHSSNIGTQLAQLITLLGGSLCKVTKSLKGPL